MHTFPGNLYRDVTCAAAATLITLALSLSFLQATSVPAAARIAVSRTFTLPATHGWFGQPQPAVLVD